MTVSGTEKTSKYAYPLLTLYDTALPDFLRKTAETPQVQRLRGVGMNCGCEYTSFPRFQRCGSYSRFDHSLGVGLIVWHFTGSKVQALSGLLHDIATPTFAHVIDFLHGDYLKQEATEADTEALIRAAPELQQLLSELGLHTEDVSDYHRYPIADNASPRLSADRLEYSLGNMLNYGIRSIEAIAGIYADLTVASNEDREPELAFRSAETAEDFAEAALACANIYVCDEDRYAMQTLAELVRDAEKAAVVGLDDLFGTEAALVDKLCTSPEFSARWSHFRAMKRIERSDSSSGGDWRMIPAKKRCIDPLVADLGRVSEISTNFRLALEEFRDRPQDYWIRGLV